MKESARLLDWQIVDASITTMHDSVSHRTPALIAIGAIPVSSIVPFVGEADSNPVVIEGPELFDQPAIELFIPLPPQEFHNLLPSLHEL